MLFRQRFKPQIWQKIRLGLWPRRSWVRSIEYLKKRVVRLSASPHVIALGFAAGAFASFTPFIGLHFLLAFALAFIIGGNMIASALGTAVGNPITFPFIWATTFKVGAYLLPETKLTVAPDELSHEFLSQSLDTILPIFSRMLVGAVPCGIIVAVVCYFPIRTITRAYQKARRRRLQKIADMAVSNSSSDGIQAAK